MKETYDEKSGRMVILVDEAGVHPGKGLGGAMKVARTKDLINQLYDAMGWPTGVRFSPDMPIEITAIDYVIDFTPGGDVGRVVVHYRFRDGTEGQLDDLSTEFPSPVLQAALTMITGPVDRLRAAHRKEVARRVERERRRAQRSSKPW